jgi:hypothetical protein
VAALLCTLVPAGLHFLHVCRCPIEEPKVLWTADAREVVQQAGSKDKARCWRRSERNETTTPLIDQRSFVSISLWWGCCPISHQRSHFITLHVAHAALAGRMRQATNDLHLLHAAAAVAPKHEWANEVPYVSTYSQETAAGVPIAFGSSFERDIR